MLPLLDLTRSRISQSCKRVILLTEERNVRLGSELRRRLRQLLLLLPPQLLRGPLLSLHRGCVVRGNRRLRRSHRRFGCGRGRAGRVQPKGRTPMGQTGEARCTGGPAAAATAAAAVLRLHPPLLLLLARLGLLGRPDEVAKGREGGRQAHPRFGQVPNVPLAALERRLAALQRVQQRQEDAQHHVAAIEQYAGKRGLGLGGEGVRGRLGGSTGAAQLAHRRSGDRRHTGNMP